MLTANLVRAQKKFGLNDKQMASFLGIRIGTYRNYKRGYKPVPKRVQKMLRKIGRRRGERSDKGTKRGPNIRTKIKLALTLKFLRAAMKANDVTQEQAEREET